MLEFVVYHGVEGPRLRQSGIGIAGKLIIGSIALLVVVIGVFALVSSWRSHRIIDELSRLQRARLVHDLRQAGTSELHLLERAVRVVLVQSDYATLQTIVEDFSGDERITVAAIVNDGGIIIAHTERALVGKPASGLLKQAVDAGRPGELREVMTGAQRSMAFYRPVLAAGSVLGTAVLAYSVQPLEADLQETELRKRREVGSSMRSMLLIGLLALLLGVALTIVQGVRLSRPIQALTVQASRMAEGDLRARVDITSRDEIGLLGHRFNHMAEQIAMLIEETKISAALQLELEVARAVQHTLLPVQRVTEVGGLRLAGIFRPAAQCGGDWWTFSELASGKVMVLIGDVTGHGVGSAMITAAVKGAATTMISTSGGRLHLLEILQGMNLAILDAARGNFSMTCFAAIYEAKTRTLSYANAGHNCPYLFDAAGLTCLAVAGDRLGDSDQGRFEVRRVSLRPGSMLFWYTDGLVESENARGQPFSERRLQGAIRRFAHHDPELVAERIVSEAQSFFGTVPPRDDITVVVGRVS